MSQQFKTITDSNSSGTLVLSSIRQFERTLYAESPSVKMVLAGTENYWIDGRHYALKTNRFLVVDNRSLVELNIDAQEAVQGLCVFPGKALINEAARARTSSTEALLDDPFDINELTLTHNQYSFQENRTGGFLAARLPDLLQLQQYTSPVNLHDFYCNLADCIVEDQLALQGTLTRVASIKKATREELFHRVARAKHFAEDNYSSNIRLNDLAAVACLSKYHFTRTFQAIYHTSPYQYLLQLRLKKAHKLLAAGFSYNQASDLVGFSDGKNLRKVIAKWSASRN